jgi:hypothetical protein
VSKNGLHRHYDRLDAQERFRLDVLAMAREDSLESERLVSSCPRFSYTMNEIGFVERWRSAIEITLRVYVPLGEQLARLQTIDDLRVFVPYSQTLLSNVTLDAYYKGHEAGSRRAWADAGKNGTPPAWQDGEPVTPDEQDPAMERDLDELEVVAEQYNRFFPEVLDELERRCARQAFSIWTGYEAFCEESVGVSAENLAAVVLEPVVEAVEEARTRAERLGVETDAELVDQMLETLTEAWDTVQARGTRRRA